MPPGGPLLPKSHELLTRTNTAPLPGISYPVNGTLRLFDRRPGPSGGRRVCVYAGNVSPRRLRLCQLQSQPDALSPRAVRSLGRVRCPLPRNRRAGCLGTNGSYSRASSFFRLVCCRSFFLSARGDQRGMRVMGMAVPILGLTSKSKTKSSGHVVGRQPVRPAAAKTGRNDSCPCKSGMKHKKCCGKAE